MLNRGFSLARGQTESNHYDKNSSESDSVNLDDVLLTDSAAYTYAIHHADLVFGSGPVNLKPVGGVDSTLQGKTGNGKPNPARTSSCHSRMSERG
jgi:hypothetical protein